MSIKKLETEVFFTFFIGPVIAAHGSDRKTNLVLICVSVVLKERKIMTFFVSFSAYSIVLLKEGFFITFG